MKLLVIVVLALLHLRGCSERVSALLVFFLLLLLAPAPTPSRRLTVVFAQRREREREPDVHISLIMSQLKYQSGARSHLTKAEVMKLRALELNETAQGRKGGAGGGSGGGRGGCQVGREAKSEAKAES